MTTTGVSLNGVTLSTAVPDAIVTSVVRPLVGKRRDVFVDVPGRAGSWKFPEEPGDRIITVEIDIQADTFEDRRAAVVALADWCDVGAVAPLIFDDESDRYHPALLENDPDPDEWLARGTPVLKFRCDPYGLAVAASSQTINATGAGSDSDTFSIDDEIFAEPEIEITPQDGTITEFTLTIAGAALSYAGPTIASGQTVTISSISDTISTGVSGDTMLTGAYNPANLAMSQVTGEFPLLEPGSNAWSLSWSGTATDIDIDIAWRRRYR